MLNVTIVVQGVRIHEPKARAIGPKLKPSSVLAVHEELFAPHVITIPPQIWINLDIAIVLCEIQTIHAQPYAISLMKLTDVRGPHAMHVVLKMEEIL
jgi:hypothetical protein